MKKLFIYFFLCYALTAYADGVTKLYPSDAEFKDFTLTGWDNVSKALFINKSNFSSAKIGDTIKVYGWDVSSDAKLYFGDYWIKPLPGSDMRNIPDAAHLPVKFCLTESMLYEILHGDNGNGRDLRIYGDHMKINRVELISCNSATVHESYRTIWKGLFEYASWTTLELYKHAFDFIDLNNFRTLRLYHDANRSDNITIKLFKDEGKWEQIAGVGTDVSITVTSTYAELTLTDDLRTTLSGLTNMLFVQGDKASGSAFNLTDIVLVPFDYEIANGASKELPTTVRNLTIHQGGSVSNADDITVTGSITYIYDAAGDAGAKLGHWYTFCLPFTPSHCYVYEEGDKDYDINAVYLTGTDANKDEPEGAGYFYLQSFNGSGWDYIGNNGIPVKDTPYIIKFLDADEDGGKGADLATYFTANPSIKFVGGAQTINGTNNATGGSPSGDYSYHANKTLRNIELTHVYTLNVAENQFEYDYGSTSVIAPFECYIKASTPALALAKPRLALRPRGSKEQTEIATAMDHIADSTAQTQKIFYNGQVVIVRDNKMYNVLGQEL